MGNVLGSRKKAGERIRLGSTNWRNSNGLNEKKDAVLFRPRHTSTSGVLLVTDEPRFSTKAKEISQMISSRGFYTVVFEWDPSSTPEQTNTGIVASLKTMHGLGVKHIGCVSFGRSGDDLLSFLRVPENNKSISGAVIFYPSLDEDHLNSISTAIPVPCLLMIAGLDNPSEETDAMIERLRSTKFQCRVFDNQSRGFVDRETTTISSAALEEMTQWLQNHVLPHQKGHLPEQPINDAKWWRGDNSFQNVGLVNWNAGRKSWKAYTHNKRPLPPPAVRVDTVIDKFETGRRAFDLPGRMTLPAAVKMLNQIWDEEIS